MAGVSPVSASPLPQQQFPTPSPFSFSVASTRWSARPPIHLSSTVLRFFALIFSFVSALALAASSSRKNGQQSSGFTHYSEFTYCFIISILVFVYSAFQLFKGVCDVAHRGILISDMIADYTGFILDQFAGYLLISCSSVAVPAIQQIEKTASLRKAAIVATSMSFATFVVIAICALLSGYKLCKRIIW